ncbi:MAG TPA: tetratricopeptide repeat protein [Nitrospirae bacterium]|nr:tetratricopeptide repeat protein [Nitrospirota bacterium]
MPKPIKKRTHKKGIAEQEVLSFYQRFRDYYEGNRRFVHIVAGILILVLIAVSFSIYYNRRLNNEAATLEYEGYKLYQGLYTTNDAKKKERLNKAYKNFQAALKMKSSPVRLLYKSYTEYKLGKKDEALITLKKLVKKYSSDSEIVPVAYYKIAMIELEKGDKEAALKTLDTLFNLKNSPFFKDVALFEKGRILESLGRKDEALRAFKILVDSFPESPYYSTALARIKNEEGPSGKKGTDKKENKKAVKK